MADAFQATPRWYRLTPGRVVVLLLALEGFLILSERFEWFAFNRHKGWTMLIAVAAVAAVMVLMFLWFLLSLIFRWRFQFSILSLLVLTVVVAIPCSWLAVARKQARQQRQVIAEILRLGGRVGYDYQFDPTGSWIGGAAPLAPPCLRNLLGDDLFAHPAWVFFAGPKTNDPDLERLRGLSQLRWLILCDAKISDAGLGRLKGLTQLQFLFLSRTKISDAGLEHLEGLTQLQWLELDEAKVSDAGLEHLKRLTQLKELGLERTNVTDAGVRDLQKALPEVSIRTQ